MSRRRYYGLPAMGLITPLGGSPAEVARRLFEGTTAGLRARGDLCRDRTLWVGEIEADLPAWPGSEHLHHSRNSRLMLAAIRQIQPAIEDAMRRFGAGRVGVILGTSTSGVSDHELARQELADKGAWPPGADYRHWEIGALSSDVARALGTGGPDYTIATACSASAKVFASARRLLAANICDAVVVGGADTLCRMTASGFSSLDAVSKGKCNPFSLNRDGINIGEGAAAFLMTRDEAPVNFLGCGEGSDAYHISAPEPEGRGARDAMSLALRDAELLPRDVAYINLHGTATPLNDSMEAKAVSSLVGTSTPCSSTKAMTGHALGAAGACEAAFTWLALHPQHNPDNRLPPHLWDGVQDPAMPPLYLSGPATRFEDRGGFAAMLSNSFAFGGNNVVLALGRGNRQ